MRVCYRSNFTGLLAVARSMTKRVTIICPTVSSAVPVHSYAPVIFRWCSTTGKKRSRFKAIDQAAAARTAEAKARYEAQLAHLECEKLACEQHHQKAAIKLINDD